MVRADAVVFIMVPTESEVSGIAGMKRRRLKRAGEIINLAGGICRWMRIHELGDDGMIGGAIERTVKWYAGAVKLSMRC